jgi:LacI family transcriptional regulator, galactose operon repressor
MIYVSAFRKRFQVEMTTIPSSSAPTIADVARQAGVSIATVSRVVNGTAAVVPETAERVRTAIAELHYTPHPAARTLASRRTHTLGLLLPEISGAFFSPMLKGIEAGVREAGYDLLIHSTQDGRHRRLGEHNTDGLLIFIGSTDNDELRRLYQLNFPTVLLHQTPPDGLQIPVIAVENKNGAEKLVEHLITEHHRKRIAFLRGQVGHEDSTWRERGYYDALAKHGIISDPALVAYGGFNEQEAFKSVTQWIKDGVALNAIFAADDESASGAILALRQAGKRVPQDVSVVGFDDVSFSRFLTPPLTTVRAPIEQVGREAVRQLVRLIRDGTSDPEVLLPTELVIRQSCGCQAAALDQSQEEYFSSTRR